MMKYQLKEDEYINPDDGLIYCKQCNTPRQTKIDICDVQCTPSIRCQCAQASYDKQEAARLERERVQRIERLKEIGLPDKQLQNCCFANDDGINPEMRHAYTYVDNWKAMERDGIGLLLWGDVGTGKSFFAGCIANALLEQEVSVLMTNFSAILNTLTGKFSKERNTYIQSLNKYSLLIIDDLGVERNSEFALEQVYHVIDSRYRSGKPLIVTTNLTIDEMKHPKDIDHARIYDRILERCIPLKINNQNIRREKAAVNLNRVRAMFGGRNQ